MADLTDIQLSAYSTSVNVTYGCTVFSRWNVHDHPLNFPSNGDVLLSPPVVVAHNDKYDIWKPDLFASEAVKKVAETGGTATLMRDLEKAREKFSVGDFFQIGEPITTEKGITEFITLSPFFDSMSSITMLDPSNGTFTGFYDAKPMMTDITADPEDSNHHYWYESFWIHTYPWHIGIKSDADTKGPNLDIGTIERTYLNDWVLGDDSSLNDSPIASWWCSIFDTSCEDHDNFHFQDKENQRDCKWLFNLEKGSEEWAKHCDRRVKGQTIHNRCPRACGMCDAEDHGVTPW